LKAVVIDYYDSFVYNIVHYLEGLDVEVTVVKDRDVVLSNLDLFDFIVLSPGPGLPEETFSMNAILSEYASKKPIIGICLGMQGIVEHFGGLLYNLNYVVHGVSIEMDILTNDDLYKGLPKKMMVGIYNSWACSLETSGELQLLSESKEKIVLSIKHKTLPIYGLQFHPESILTENGKQMLRNFVENVVFLEPLKHKL
jgi:anthranilate synthase component II